MLQGRGAYDKVGRCGTMPSMSEPLIVNEIYRTVQGEGAQAGRVCTIVRLTGCNLRCSWCDTQYAYEEGGPMTPAEILGQVRRLGSRFVLVSGGEPLAQPGALELLERLCDEGFDAALETNGSLDISAVDARVCRCVDVKCPGSGQAGSFLASNFEALGPGDEVKFILADRADYEFARRVIASGAVSSAGRIVLTPAAGALAAAELVGWMLEDAGLPDAVRLGLQLHKVIWPAALRGV
jgi:7-carboxy-7-deazaguanine synthase